LTVVPTPGSSTAKSRNSEASRINGVITLAAATPRTDATRITSRPIAPKITVRSR
jgi:hypothetical protein